MQNLPKYPSSDISPKLAITSASNRIAKFIGNGNLADIDKIWKSTARSRIAEIAEIANPGDLGKISKSAASGKIANLFSSKQICYLLNSLSNSVNLLSVQVINTVANNLTNAGYLFDLPLAKEVLISWESKLLII